MWELPILPWTAKSAAANEKGDHCEQNTGDFPHILPLCHCNEMLHRGTDLSLFRIRDGIRNHDEESIF
jgi:hypothetical protein